MTRTEARNLIEENARRTLVVRFIKRTDGTLRRMACIYYPQAARRTTFKFNPVEKGLIPVFDIEKGARRFINLDGVKSIKRSGKRLDPKERREADREALPQTLEEANREMKELFG